MRGNTYRDLPPTDNLITAVKFQYIQPYDTGLQLESRTGAWRCRGGWDTPSDIHKAARRNRPLPLRGRKSTTPDCPVSPSSLILNPGDTAGVNCNWRNGYHNYTNVALHINYMLSVDIQARKGDFFVRGEESVSKSVNFDFLLSIFSGSNFFAYLWENVLMYFRVVTNYTPPPPI